jgi:hypothetical protein
MAVYRFPEVKSNSIGVKLGSVYPLDLSQKALDVSSPPETITFKPHPCYRLSRAN